MDLSSPFSFLRQSPSSSHPLVGTLFARTRPAFHPWLPTFFQSSRCNDFNLEVRSQHTRGRRAPPTPIPPRELAPRPSFSVTTRRDKRQRSKFFVAQKQGAFATRSFLSDKEKGRRDTSRDGGRKSKWSGNRWTRVGRAEEEKAAQETRRKRG